ncbi:hypothetical protein ACFL6C_14475, partial [Myxococcota bacterium]
MGMHRTVTSLLFVFLSGVVSLSGCGITVSDGIDPSDVIKVDASSFRTSGRQQIVRAGGAGGDVWAIGSGDDPSLSMWRGSLATGPGWKKSHLLDDTQWSSASRIVVAAHPDLSVIYLAGGIYNYPSQSNYSQLPELPDMAGVTGIHPTIPSLQVVTQTDHELPTTPGAGAYIIHPAAARTDAENAPPAVGPRLWHAAISSGDEMLAVGGLQLSKSAGPDNPGVSQQPWADGVGYDPSTDTWQTIPPHGGSTLATAVWADGALWLVGGAQPSGDADQCAAPSVFRFVPSGTTGQWHDMPGLEPTPSEESAACGESGQVSSRVLHTTVWTDKEVLVWGGVSCLKSLSQLNLEPCNEAHYYATGLRQTPNLLI